MLCNIMSTVTGCIDEDLLFSPSLLQLWRTGADNYIYSYTEDGDVDVCYEVHHDTIDLFVYCFMQSLAASTIS